MADETPIDPKDLPPEVAAAAAAAMGAKGQSWWERNIKPYQRPVANVLGYWPPGTPDFIKKLGPPGAAKELSEQIVPSTATDAALNALMLAMPEGRMLEALPPPVRALLKSRLGRIGMMTGAGYGAGKLTGEGGPKGAAKGAFGQTAGEVGSVAFRRLTEGNEAARYIRNLGPKIQDQYPIIGSALQRLKKNLSTASDYLVFKGGMKSPAMKEASAILDEMKTAVEGAIGGRYQAMRRSPAFQNLIRDNPAEARELGIGTGSPLTFRRMDEFISRARANAYSLATGAGKDAAKAARIRINADQALDDLASQLNTLAPGSGELYRSAQGDWHQARQLADMFTEKGVFEGGAVSPSRLQELAMEGERTGYFTDLGDTPVRSQIFRGGDATGTDRPRGGIRIHYGHMGAHINPFGTKRVGAEPVELYHGIPAITGKAVANWFSGDN